MDASRGGRRRRNGRTHARSCPHGKQAGLSEAANEQANKQPVSYELGIMHTHAAPRGAPRAGLLAEWVNEGAERGGLDGHSMHPLSALRRFGAFVAVALRRMPCVDIKYAWLSWQGWQPGCRLLCGLCAPRAGRVRPPVTDCQATPPRTVAQRTVTSLTARSFADSTTRLDLTRRSFAHSHSLTHSLTTARPFLPSFVRSFARSFVRSFVRSVIRFRSLSRRRQPIDLWGWEAVSERKRASERRRARERRQCATARPARPPATHSLRKPSLFL